MCVLTATLLPSPELGCVFEEGQGEAGFDERLLVLVIKDDRQQREYDSDTLYKLGSYTSGDIASSPTASGKTSRAWANRRIAARL